MRALDGVYMDDVVFQAPFKLFVAKIMSGWQLDVVNVSNIEYISLGSLPTKWIKLDMLYI